MFTMKSKKRIRKQIQEIWDEYKGGKLIPLELFQLYRKLKKDNFNEHL